MKSIMTVAMLNKLEILARGIPEGGSGIYY